jgi:dethiobiotin synthetase
MSRKIFISGNGTDVGKTIVSACLVHALQADYWKPIQAGSLDFSDADFVADLAGESIGEIHSSRFNLTKPMSPHAAADIDKVQINLVDFEIPQTENALIVEGAGGLLVPINKRDTILDIAAHLNLPMVLVCGNYLGSINHSLLSIQAAQSAGIDVLGLIFFGVEVETTEEIILSKTGLKKLGGVYPKGLIDNENIHEYSNQFKNLV